MLIALTFVEPAQPPFDVPQWLQWLIEVSNGTIFAIAGALIAFAGVWWTTIRADRRARVDRLTLDVREREHGRYNRFSEIVTQMASPELPVRLGGLYSLSALADEWQRESRNWDARRLRIWNQRPSWWRTKARESKENTLTQRNACIELLCAYLRTPPNSSGSASKEKVDRNKNKYIEELVNEIEARAYEVHRVDNKIKYRLIHPDDIASFSEWALYPGSMPDWDARMAAFRIIQDHTRIGARFVWRPELINLTGATLEGLDLDYSQLRGVNLSGAHLAGASIKYADLREAIFTGADLRGAQLFNSKLQRANLQKCLLNGTDLRKASLIAASMQESDLQGAFLRYEHMGLGRSGKGVKNTNLYHADLRKTVLNHANLQHTMLVGINLRRSKMYGVKLKGADLRGVHLENARVLVAAEDAKLDNCDLRGVNLEFGYLDAWDVGHEVSLEGADLRYANLQGASLGRISMRGANLVGAKLGGADLSRVDLRDADIGTGTEAESSFVAHYKVLLFWHKILTTKLNEKMFWPEGVDLTELLMHQEEEIRKNLPKWRIVPSYF